MSSFFEFFNPIATRELGGDNDEETKIYDKKIVDIMTMTNSFSDFTDLMNKAKEMKENNKLNEYIENLSQIYNYLREKNIKSKTFLKSILNTNQYNNDIVKNSEKIFDKIKNH